MMPCMTNDHTFLMKIRVIGSDHAATGIRIEFQDDVETMLRFVSCSCLVLFSIAMQVSCLLIHRPVPIQGCHKILINAHKLLATPKEYDYDC